MYINILLRRNVYIFFTPFPQGGYTAESFAFSDSVEDWTTVYRNWWLADFSLFCVACQWSQGLQLHLGSVNWNYLRHSGAIVLFWWRMPFLLHYLSIFSFFCESSASFSCEDVGVGASTCGTINGGGKGPKSPSVSLGSWDITINDPWLWQVIDEWESLLTWWCNGYV